MLSERALHVFVDHIFLFIVIYLHFHVFFIETVLYCAALVHNT